MARTYFQNFTRNDGSPVTVEYNFHSGSEASYSPMYGASSGDACEVEIVASWPNTPEFNSLCERHRDLPSQALKVEIEAAERASELSDTERGRMETWLAEHHVSDDYFDEF